MYLFILNIINRLRQKNKERREYLLSGRVHPESGVKIFPDGGCCAGVYKYGKYLYYNSADGRRWSIHRSVAQLFIPNPDSKPVVNHKDGNKYNNNTGNLEWVTYSENTLHAYDNNLFKCRRLTKREIREIRAHRAAGKDLLGLASKYGVSHETIFNIITNKIWKNVK